MMRISDRALRRWLENGRPRRVERHLERPDVASRLEALTELSDGQTQALRQAVEPPPDLDERLTGKLRRQLERESLDVVIDLLGLGWHTAATMFEPRRRPDEPAGDPEDDPEHPS